MALTGLVKLATLRRLWRTHRSEFFVAMAAFAGVLGSGILRGVLIGSILSLLVLMHRAAQPHVAFLGRIPSTDRFSDIERHPGNEPVPGALLFRVEQRHRLLQRRGRARRGLGARQRIARADSARGLRPVGRPARRHGRRRDDRRPRAEFAARGIAFRVVEARASVRDVLRLEGLEQLLGPISRRTTLAQAVEEFLSQDVVRVR